MLKLFRSIKTLYVPEEEVNKYDPEHLSFFNINTPEDMDEAAHLINRLER
jgi:molybdopterin-guanine dinucleotide biosynthesis protein A